ncbi:MAG TPA: UDP-N-acetylmuramoyl-L-alanine--D-glutamate ligase [Anaerolineae bacterium]|nr:UDP-N-acetylmuramoyl-L-alanine--D-glutamate ligase [Anaerolineae bacterium]
MTHDPLHGKNLLIMGIARQGTALARFACHHGANVTLTDLRSAADLAPTLATLADLPLTLELGHHPPALLDTTDLIAISGAVPADVPFLQQARQRGIPITNDSAIFLQRAPAPTIGITGSAGKSTTTALTGAMAAATGQPSWVGGNIGHPLLLDLPHIGPDDYIIQELSSFQLEIWSQSPAIAAILNITPNHLDRHRTMDIYAQAKANIIRFQKETDIAVLNPHDPQTWALRDLTPARIRTFSLTEPVPDGAFVRDEHIYLRDGYQETTVAPVIATPLRGRHNLANVLAATLLADSAGIPHKAIHYAIHTFKGVPHRLEQVTIHRGVTYINDSIATAPERVLAALTAFDEPIILLAGGRDKAMVWDNWCQQVAQRVKHTVLFGALGPMLAERLGPTPHTITPDLETAVRTAAQLAQTGDIVLLSPGGTSFDAYPDFAARGQHFRQLVHDL